MLKSERITLQNVDMALDVFHRIFNDLAKEFDPYTSILKGDFPEKKSQYFLVYDGDAVVAIYGIYIAPAATESAILGWFGVLPEKRRFHYGSRVLALMEETSKSQGYRFVRLYTEAEHNDSARKFYENLGYVCEVYDCPQEPEVLRGKFVSYSKSLGDWSLVPWNSRYLGIAEELIAKYPPEMREKIIKQFESGQK